MKMILLVCVLVVSIVTMVCSLLTTIIVVKKNKEKELVIKTLKICGIVVLVGLIIGLAFGVSKMNGSTSNNKKQTTTVSSSSSVELEEAGFNEVTIDEYLKLVNSSEKSIILVARPTCYYCQQFTPVLKQAMEDMNLTINYINTDNLSSDDWTSFQDSLDYLKDEEWGTPLTMIVQDGKLVDKNSGYVELDAIKDFFTSNGFGK